MKKNPLNYLMVIGVVGIATAAIAAYAGTPFKSVKSFGIECQTTPTLINNGDGGYNSVRCDSGPSATGSYIGGPNVMANPMFGYQICKTAQCSDSALTLDASMNAYCISANPGAPSFISCIAGK